jgi:signal transduction histidine kinase
MTEEQVKKALEKYGRIENENSGKIDSFGLGLPLVKFLVEAQNGKMKIESIVGVGTKVILTF